jgi:hypothetical protein
VSGCEFPVFEPSGLRVGFGVLSQLAFPKDVDGPVRAHVPADFASRAIIRPRQDDDRVTMAIHFITQLQAARRT